MPRTNPILLNEGARRLLEIGIKRDVIDLEYIGDFVEFYELERANISSYEGVACIKSARLEDNNFFRAYYQIKENGQRLIGAEIQTPRLVIDNHIITMVDVPEAVLSAQRQKLNNGLMASHLIDISEVQDIEIFDMIGANPDGNQIGMNYVLDNVWTTNSWEFKNEKIIPWEPR